MEPQATRNDGSGDADSMPPRAPRQIVAFQPVEAPPAALQSGPGGMPPSEGRGVSTPRPDSAEPLDAARSRLHVTVSRRFLEKLEAARDALSHARPGASAEDILEAGLDLVLAGNRKRKGVVDKPRAGTRPSRAEHVPAHVKRDAWIRAGGRCEWPLDGGGVCGSTCRLEFDHVVPRALGGPSTSSNIRVLCAVHNQLYAEQTYGREHMATFRRKPDRDDASTCESARTTLAT